MNLRVNSEESVLRVGELLVRERFKLDPSVLSYSSTEGERTLGTSLREVPIFIWRCIQILQENYFTAEKAAAWQACIEK